MVDLYELRQLAAFAELGTLSRVAEEFHLSTPSVTRSMQHLEAYFGVPLFRRGKNRSELNDTGRLAVSHAQKLLSAAEDAVRAQIDGCDAVLIGCGMGRSEESDALTRRLIDMDKPLVLDADGINAFEPHIPEIKRRQGKVTVMTPHEGEFFRAGGDLSRGRESGARAYAARWGVYLVLKGHRTIVAAPDGRLAVNTTGNSGMAKGGSGDILSGMVVSLLGQGMEPFDACCAAVYCHGRAGDMAAAELGEHGMSPADLLSRLPYAFKETEQG